MIDFDETGEINYTLPLPDGGEVTVKAVFKHTTNLGPAEHEKIKRERVLKVTRRYARHLARALGHDF